MRRRPTYPTHRLLRCSREQGRPPNHLRTAMARRHHFSWQDSLLKELN